MQPLQHKTLVLISFPFIKITILFRKWRKTFDFFTFIFITEQSWNKIILWHTCRVMHNIILRCSRCKFHRYLAAPCNLPVHGVWYPSWALNIHTGISMYMYRETLSINVPVVFMVRYIMVLRGATSFRGAFSRVPFGPKKGVSEVSRKNKKGGCYHPRW